MVACDQLELSKFFDLARHHSKTHGNHCLLRIWALRRKV